MCHLAMPVFWSAHKIQPANPGTCKSVCTFVLGLLCPGLTEDAAFVHPVSGYTAIVCLRSPFQLGFFPKQMAIPSVKGITKTGVSENAKKGMKNGKEIARVKISYTFQLI